MFNRRIEFGAWPHSPVEIKESDTMETLFLLNRLTKPGIQNVSGISINSGLFLWNSRAMDVRIR